MNCQSILINVTFGPLAPARIPPASVTLHICQSQQSLNARVRSVRYFHVK